MTFGVAAAVWGQTAGGVEVATRARAFQPGELVVVTATVPAAADALRVRALGRVVPAFRMDDRTWQALVGIDLAVAPGKYSVSVETTTGRRLGQSLITIVSKTFPTRRLTVDPTFVNPPPAAIERLTREAAELAALWKAPASERLWTGGFVAPVPTEATGSFGSRSVFNGQPRTPHGGADFPSPEGAPIQAPSGGRIVLARDLYFTGNTIVIDHGLGLFSLLAHLSSFAVREGERIEAGQVIGAVGATGRVTGPHLHWAVRANDARVDPLSVLALLR
ncbi:MAG: peptidoglycan DD-metalloendopeptidase family protein [Vicinamibacterales bacterium]